MSLQNQVQQAFIYVVEYLVGEQTQRVLVHAFDAPNGVVMDAPEGSDSYIGNLLNGKQIEIPIAAVTNVFAWWKVKEKNNQGHKTYYLDDKAMNNYVEGSQGRQEKWDENGSLKNVEKVEKPPNDGKIIRGK
ncbi:hypothetical protein K9N68_10780 [Kovacikia minuta CCNUW1]|uniref:hypothetical protein n=1 Tax=Kovacikia minuta TaxID=2931930 RepID=UPI001CCC7128|nr:hypothetical protein [Kovacikia minuta]UBF28313.1 hypothetical protein K9N68_10780 [Kovacikia minuta CCNUW1]